MRKNEQRTIGDAFDAIREGGVGRAYQIYQQGMAQVSIFYSIMNFLLLVTINPYVARLGAGVIIALALVLVIIPLFIGIIYWAKFYHNQFQINPFNTRLLKGKETLMWEWQLAFIRMQKRHAHGAELRELVRLERAFKEMLANA